MLADRKFSDITVTDLCRELSIPRKTFYRYFDSIDDVLNSYTADVLANYHENSPALENPRNPVKEMEYFFVFWRDHKAFLDALAGSDMLDLLVRVSTDFPIASFLNLQHLMPDEESDEVRVLLFKFALTGLFTTMFEWYRSGFARSVPEVARVAVRLLTSPIFKKFTPEMLEGVK